MDKTKHPTGKNGRKKAKKTAAPDPPTWKPFLGSYHDLHCLVFADDVELEKGVELLWANDLRDLPHGWANGHTLVIPSEAVPYFERAGLKFTANKMKAIGDFSPEQIDAMRRN